MKNNDTYSDLIFDKSRKGKVGYSLPDSDCPPIQFKDKIESNLLNDGENRLPEVSEPEVVRHFVNLSIKIQHIDTKFKNGIKRYWNYSCGVQIIAKKLNPDIFISADLFSLAICAKQNKNCIKIFDSRELYSKLAALVNKQLVQYFWSLYEKIFYT